MAGPSGPESGPQNVPRVNGDVVDQERVSRAPFCGDVQSLSEAVTTGKDIVELRRVSYNSIAQAYALIATRTG